MQEAQGNLLHAKISQSQLRKRIKNMIADFPFWNRWSCAMSTGTNTITGRGSFASLNSCHNTMARTRLSTLIRNTQQIPWIFWTRQTFLLPSTLPSWYLKSRTTPNFFWMRIRKTGANQVARRHRVMLRSWYRRWKMTWKRLPIPGSMSRLQGWRLRSLVIWPGTQGHRGSFWAKPEPQHYLGRRYLDRATAL